MILQNTGSSVDCPLMACVRSKHLNSPGSPEQVTGAGYNCLVQDSITLHDVFILREMSLCRGELNVVFSVFLDQSGQRNKMQPTSSISTKLEMYSSSI